MEKCIIDRHYCSTTYLLSQTEPKTLLHFHQKLQTWLPPGGHVEKNESPYEAAVREVVEETSLSPADLWFVPNGDRPGQIDERAKILELPHMLLEELIEENHYHLDWIFYAKIDSSLFDGERVDPDFKWFDIHQLQNEQQIFENVKKLAIKGIKDFCE